MRCDGRTLGEPVWCQLGEFLLISVGDSSDRGRGIPLGIFFEAEFGVALLMRKGWTCSRKSQRHFVQKKGERSGLHTGSEAMLK